MQDSLFLTLYLYYICICNCITLVFVYLYCICVSVLYLYSHDYIDAQPWFLAAASVEEHLQSEQGGSPHSLELGSLDH